MKFSIILAALLLACSGLSVWAGPEQFTDAQIKSILVNRIDVLKKSVGIVVGIAGPFGTRTIAYGNRTQSGPPVNGDTVFAVGSLTRTFTALAALEMAARGEINLNNPISNYLPKSIRVPGFNGAPITVAHLISDTSGLPQLPPNLQAGASPDPVGSYGTAQMLAALETLKLTRTPGSQVEYSNLGYGILGYILTTKSGLDFDSLIVQRVCRPLNMNHTRGALTPDLANTGAAGGHGPTLAAVVTAGAPALAASNAIYSTVNDLLKLASFALGINASTPALSTAISQSLRSGLSTKAPSLQIGFGWMLQTKGGFTIAWQDGSSSGYRSFVALDPVHRTGVVILSNSANSVSDLALYLMDSADYQLSTR